MKRYTSRAFPPYRHEPGRTPHPERSPEGYRYDEAKTHPPSRRPLTEKDWRSNDDYLYGVDLFNAGYFWEAHAVWEELWIGADTDEMSAFLRSLIQLTAGCLKRSTGRPEGARKLFASARARLERLAETSTSTSTSTSPTFAGIDLCALSAAAENPEGGTICIVLRS